MFDVDRCRGQFPALARRQGDAPCVFFDGPAGSQVPQRVIDAIGDYLCRMNANHGGLFATSRESDALLDEAHQAAADFLGVDDPDTTVFGANMTTLTLALSRALGRTWQPGDEVLVTRLDHDANVTPWALAARDAGANVRHVNIRAADCTLDLDDLRRQLTGRVKLVAVGAASNSVGTVNPVAEITALAHKAGAAVFVDAVHYAPHRPIDARAWDCDFVVCSAYKFFGPHVGVLWGRRELLENLLAYKVRPASNDLPGKWMTGTQNHECIAGVLAAIEYLADLGRSGGAAPSRRNALEAAFAEIQQHEERLCRRLIEGLARLKGVRLWGIAEVDRMAERVPTLSITHSRLSPAELAAHLAREGIFVWHGNYYALSLSEALGREPEGMVRIGLLHYNTAPEVDRLLAVLEQLD